ncbi:MAG: type II secretion system protein [bacterium]
MRQRGFTLVELLVVITIIGILVSIAVPNYNRIRNKAKEQQAIAGGHAITVALETFAQSHNGLYPGVALPNCDTSGPSGWGTDQTFFVTTATGGTNSFVTLSRMRGIIGGGTVEPGKPIDYMDNFYFEPRADSTVPRALPDRLVADGALDTYPQNPFIRNIPGVTDQGRPMINVFGIESDIANFNLAGDDPDVPLGLNICYPQVQGFPAAGNYQFATAGVDPWPLSAGGSQVSGPGNLRYDRNNNYRVDKGETATTFIFPEGDFAYIPLDPIERDPSASDFLRFTKNYWLVIYGTKETAQTNKYENVQPNFPPPLGDGNVATLTAYETMAKRALVGAAKVYASAYEDQLLVASDQ